MKKKKTKKKLEKEIKLPPPADPEKDDPFDFGGLPQRDLKKSLGCG